MEDRKRCTVYIDEAGDLGINRGSQWFVLSGVVINDDAEKDMRDIIQAIKTHLNVNYIHFRSFKYEQKCFIVNEICKGDFQFINIILDTGKIKIEPRYNDPPAVATYNFACRLLLERVSWLLRDTGRIGKIVLSSRGTSRDNELIAYINNKLIPYTDMWNYFYRVTSKAAKSWDMLQLADICATSVFYRFQRNLYNLIAPCFLLRLSGHIYSYNGKVDSYGIKYYSDEMKPQQKWYEDNVICKIK